VKFLVLLLGAMGAVIVAPARADDLTIDKKTTSPVSTTAAANNTPGNITITSGGSVEIKTAGAAVTINSNNTVSNSGTISNSVGTNGVGVDIIGGNMGSFTHMGTISAGSTSTVTLAGQYGVLLNAPTNPSFTGTTSGTNLTASSVTGVIAVGDVVAGTNIPSGTYIVSQTSGTPGGAGVYVISQAATATVSNASLTAGGPSFTGTGSGTSLTVSSVTGLISVGDVLSGAGVPSGTTIISQVSGAPGGAGVYVTSQTTTASSATLSGSVTLGPFTGNIVTKSGSIINVWGFGADAISIQSELKGNLTTGGTITATGSTAGGILATAPVDGAITNTGTIQTTNGICISTCLQNAITTTGSGLTTTGSTSLASGWAIAVGNNVGGGILNAGPLNSTDKTPVATLLAIGSSPALIVAPSVASDATSLTIGVLSDSNAPGNSIINRGNIVTNGEQPGVSALALQIGNGTSDTSALATTLAGGVYNSGTIGALATSQSISPATLKSAASNANAIVIGLGAVVPSLTNTASGTISATTGGPLGGNATAISIEAGPTTPSPNNPSLQIPDANNPSLQSLTNLGTISASANTTDTTITTLSAYAIQDSAGTLTNITNGGTISAAATPLDNNAQVAIAADLSAATTPITFNNTGKVTGDILFGNAGGNQLKIEGPNASVSGQIRAVGLGTVNIAVSAGGTGGTLATSGVVNAGNLTVGPGGTLNVGIGTSTTVVSTNGPASFDAASHLLITPISLLPTNTSIRLIHSNTSLSFANFAATIATAKIPFMFTGSLNTDGQNLTLTLQQKTASQLGLTGNAAAIYEPAITAALRDAQFGAALGILGSQAQVESALNQLLPTITTATQVMAETLTDANANSVGARQRLLTLASSPEPGFNPWIQGFYDMFNGWNQNGYTGHGAGGVFGVDYSDADKGHLGLAFTIQDARVRERIPGTTTIDAQWYLLSPYMGFRAQNFFVNAQFNAGAAQFQNQRVINIGTMTRTATSTPTAALASGTVTGGYILNFGSIQLIPQAGLDGTALFNQDYTEQGGGAGIDLTVASHNQNSARGFIALGASGTYEAIGGRLVPQVLVGWGYQFGANSDSITGAFTSVPFSNFTVSAPGLDRSRLTGSVGFDYLVGDLSIGVTYNAASTANTLSQTAFIRFAGRF